jgi:adenylate cyclase
MSQAQPQIAVSLRGLWRRVYAVGAVLALLATLAIPMTHPFLLRLEHSTSDLRIRTLAPRLDAPHPSVAMVTITDETFPALGVQRTQPMNRAMLAEVLRRLDGVGACAIGIDIFFATPTDNDARFLAQLRAMRTPVVLGVADSRISMTPDRRAFQARFLREAALPAAYINLRMEPEDDTARMFPKAADDGIYKESFALRLARYLRPDAPLPEGRRIAWLRKPLAADTFLTVPAHTLPVDVREQPPSCGSSGAGLAGRVILLGADLPNLDRHRTPFSPQLAEPHSGLFIHAQMTADIVDGAAREIRELTPLQSTLLQAVLAIAGLLLGWRFSASSIVNSLGWTAGTGLLLALGVMCFVVWNLVLPFTVALFTWFFAVTSGRSLRALRL